MARLSPSHETAKIGADNPDNLYQYARLDGRCRISRDGAARQWPT